MNITSTTPSTAALFEAELQKRGVAFEREPGTDRYELALGDPCLKVSLDNLERDMKLDGDVGHVGAFVDVILECGITTPISLDSLHWALEPNDYEESAEFRKPLSRLVDRVLVSYSERSNAIAWLSHQRLDVLGISLEEAEEVADSNMSFALEDSILEVEDVDGIKLGYFDCSLPFKAALILAPNLKEQVQEQLGWPLLAVAPDRDFLYLWSAEHVDFAGRLGSTVIKEYSRAPYPLSTEVYRIDDNGIEAIGAFPVVPG